MYLVDVEVKASSIHGKGVFTIAPIKSGQVVWKFESGYDIAITPKEFNFLSRDEQTKLRRVAYLSAQTNRWIYPPENDPALYTNHSEENNLSVVIDTALSAEPMFIANRNIAASEELTNNYRDFDTLSNEASFIENQSRS